MKLRTAAVQLKSKKVALVIGHWAFGHIEQSDELLERPPSNSFPMPKATFIESAV